MLRVLLLSRVCCFNVSPTYARSPRVRGCLTAPNPGYINGEQGFYVTLTRRTMQPDTYTFRNVSIVRCGRVAPFLLFFDQSLHIRVSILTDEARRSVLNNKKQGGGVLAQVTNPTHTHKGCSRSFWFTSSDESVYTFFSIYLFPTFVGV